MSQFQTLPVFDAWFPVRHVLRATRPCSWACAFCPKPPFLRDREPEYDFDTAPPPGQRIGLGAGRDEFFDGLDAGVRRAALTRTLDEGNGVLILTRSALVTRYAPLLVKRPIPTIVVFSFSGADGFGEPDGMDGFPSVEARLAAMKSLASEHLATGYFLSPLDPEQADVEGQINLALDQACDGGAAFVQMDFKRGTDIPDARARELGRIFDAGAFQRGLDIRAPFEVASLGLDGRDRAILALHHAWMYLRHLGKERSALAQAALAVNWTTSDRYHDLVTRGSLRQIRGVGPWIEGFLHKLHEGGDPLRELRIQITG